MLPPRSADARPGPSGSHGSLPHCSREATQGEAGKTASRPLQHDRLSPSPSFVNSRSRTDAATNLTSCHNYRHFVRNTSYLFLTLKALMMIVLGRILGTVPGVCARSPGFQRRKRRVDSDVAQRHYHVRAPQCLRIACFSGALRHSGSHCYHLRSCERAGRRALHGISAAITSSHAGGC